MRLQAVLLSVAIIAFFAFEGIICESTSTQRSVVHHHSRGSAQHHLHRNNKTDLNAAADTVIRLDDKDKYYDDASSDDDDYVYEDGDDDGTKNGTLLLDVDDDNNKFIEGDDSGIVFDHVEFVTLRLKHISMRTSSNLTEILAVQKQEFKVNSHYKLGWETAAKVFNETKRTKIFNNTLRSSIVQQVPEEYHIALIAYTLGEPAMYAEFNKDTREICSGTQIDNYQWKSYFKLLQLAVQTLGSQTERWMDKQRFLYRGASRKFAVKEGQILAFQHFISTSSALISAENFAGASLFEFQGYYNGTAMAIWDHSFYEHEKEVLFSPLQVFQVDSIHVGTHYTRYVLVKHELAPPCATDPSSSSPTRGKGGNDDTSRLENYNALLHAQSAGSSSKIRENSRCVLTSFLVAVGVSLLAVWRVD